MSDKNNSLHLNTRILVCKKTVITNHRYKLYLNPRHKNCSDLGLEATLPLKKKKIWNGLVAVPKKKKKKNIAGAFNPSEHFQPDVGNC